MGMGSSLCCCPQPCGQVVVREMVTRAYRRAKDLVSTNINILHKLAEHEIERRSAASFQPSKSSADV